MIEIKAYKAEAGDAFWISIDNNSINVFVDMGFASTYTSYIRSDLLALKKNGHKIDLLIVTHVDKDHIEGVLEFVKENGANSKIIEVGEVWHNSYRHLQLGKKTN